MPSRVQSHIRSEEPVFRPNNKLVRCSVPAECRAVRISDLLPHCCLKRLGREFRCHIFVLELIDRLRIKFNSMFKEMIFQLPPVPESKFGRQVARSAPEWFQYTKPYLTLVNSFDVGHNEMHGVAKSIGSTKYLFGSRG